MSPSVFSFDRLNSLKAYQTSNEQFIKKWLVPRASCYFWVSVFMNRVTTIFKGKSLVIERFDHPEDCSHQDPKSEGTEQTVVTFVERGAFEVLEDRKWWTFKQGDVLVPISLTQLAAFLSDAPFVVIWKGIFHMSRRCPCDCLTVTAGYYTQRHVDAC